MELNSFDFNEYVSNFITISFFVSAFLAWLHNKKNNKRKRPLYFFLYLFSMWLLFIVFNLIVRI